MDVGATTVERHEFSVTLSLTRAKLQRGNAAVGPSLAFWERGEATFLFRHLAMNLPFPAYPKAAAVAGEIVALVQATVQAFA